MTQPDLETLARECAEDIHHFIRSAIPQSTARKILSALERATESVRAELEQCKGTVVRGSFGATEAWASANMELRAQLAAANEQLRKNAEQYYNAGVALGVADPEHYSLEDAVDDLQGQLAAASERESKYRGALEDVLSHRSNDKDGNYVCWLGETSFLLCEAAMAQQKGGGNPNESEAKK